MDSEFPPHVRAQKRLLHLIRNNDVAGIQPNTFDPWRMALLDSKLAAMMLDNNGNETPHFVEWRRFRELYKQAETDWQGPFMQRPWAQVSAAEFCLKLRDDIESGDGVAVLECVAQCAAHGLALPGWLAVAFVERYQRVISGACNGWGDADAFGTVIPKGKNIASVRAAAQFEPWAYAVAIELLLDNPSRPIEMYFYEQVGEKIGRKATQVQSLLKRYCKDGFHAPLTFIRDGLLNGESLEKVVCQWADARYDKLCE